MNALIGNVKVFTINPAADYMVWYKSPVEGAPGYLVTTDAHLIAQDGDFLLINSGWESKVIHISEVDRIQTCRAHENHELYVEASQQYEAGY